MAILHILLHPHPTLRVVCAPVTVFDDALALLAEDMLETMYAAPGRGLAAPQVGRRSRIFVMDPTWKDGSPRPRIVVNPAIVARSETMVSIEEGCLSIPGPLRRVSRPAEVTIRAQGLDGGAWEETFTGIEAVIVQHETDHLDGILTLDHPEAPA